MISHDFSKKAAWIFILLLAPIFFFMHHDVNFSYGGGSIENTVSFEEQAIEGNINRRIALFSLGLFSLLSLIFTKRQNLLKYDDPLGWVLLFFVVWSLASILWSIDVTVTARRLIGFGVFCLGALAMTSRFSADFLPECVFYITALYLAAGLSVEIIHHAFTPLSGDYRFSGTVHPNIQAINCAMLLLSAVSLAGSPGRRRNVFLAAAAIAFVFLILTKSRTSLLCALLALGFLSFLNSSNKSRGLIYLLGIVFVYSIFYLFLGERLLPSVRETFLLGRDPEETLTFTGRTYLWEASLDYAWLRPFHGYGFNSFWTPRHLRAFSEAMGWPIPDAHSAYIDLLLNIGLVGLVSYVSALFLGIKKAIAGYLKTEGTGYGFLCMLFLFFFFHGLTESGITQISSLGSFVLIWGLLTMGFLSPAPDENQVGG